MLTHLQIRDFAIIESVELEFGRGFTAPSPAPPRLALRLREHLMPCTCERHLS